MAEKKNNTQLIWPHGFCSVLLVAVHIRAHRVRNHWWAAIGSNLVGELVRACLDGHAGAVEALREENLFATEAMVGSCKFKLGEGKGMAQVQQAVHVGIGKVAKKLVVGVGSPCH